MRKLSTQQQYVEMEGEELRHRLSFRDKLVGRTAVDEEHEDWISDEDEEDSVPFYLTISLSKEEKRRIRRPWMFSLIIKLLGRTIEFKTLQAKILELWKHKAALNLVAMDNGFFLVKFSSPED